MAMQERGKVSANGSGASSLTDDEAEEFAASFRPAWDDDDLAIAPEAGGAAVAPTAPVAPAARPIVGSPVLMVGGSAEVAEARSPALAKTSPMIPHDAKAQLPPTGAKPSTAPGAKPSTAPVAKPSTAPVAKPSTTAPMPKGATQPSLRPRTPAAAAAVDSLEIDAFAPKRSKTILYVGIGIALAAGLGFFLKVRAADQAPVDPKAAPQALAPTAAVPPATSHNDAPSATAERQPATPPPTEPAVTAQAAATASPAVAATAPAKASLDAPAKVGTEPPRPHPNAVPATPPPAPPPHAEAKPTRPAPPAPAPAAPPKSPPKAPGGGIVRDSPF